MHADVWRETHGLEHLRSEHAAVADLDPSVQHRVEGEDLQGRLGERKEHVNGCRCTGDNGERWQESKYLGVRVVRRLEPQILDAHLVEEGAHEALNAAKGESKTAEQGE